MISVLCKVGQDVMNKNDEELTKSGLSTEVVAWRDLCNVQEGSSIRYIQLYGLDASHSRFPKPHLPMLERIFAPKLVFAEVMAFDDPDHDELLERQGGYGARAGVPDTTV